MRPDPLAYLTAKTNGLSDLALEILEAPLRAASTRLFDRPREGLGEGCLRSIG